MYKTYPHLHYRGGNKNTLYRIVQVSELIAVIYTINESGAYYLDLNPADSVKFLKALRKPSNKLLVTESIITHQKRISPLETDSYYENKLQEIIAKERKPK